MGERALDRYTMELRRRNDGLREAVVLYEDLAAELDRLRAIESRARTVLDPRSVVGRNLWDSRITAEYILGDES